jgi:hypothetical protein
LGRSKINRGRLRREELRSSADERRESRASRSNSEQIELLNARLGKNVGAVRERKRLEVDGDGETNKQKPSSSGSTRQARKKAKAAKHRARRERDGE